MQFRTVLRHLLGMLAAMVIIRWRLVTDGRDRPLVEVRVRHRRRPSGRYPCGRCGAPAARYDRGRGAPRRWRHLDMGFGTCELVARLWRVDCPGCGPTTVGVSWARHGSAFTRAFEDLVAYTAVAANKSHAARRYGIGWKAVDNICERVLAEALNGVDLLEGLVAIGIDEVKAKKGQRYLTVVSDHFTGRVIWAKKGRSKDVVGKFFDDLGEDRSKALGFVTADGAEWIRTVVAERAPDAVICLDTFHLIGWATKALDEVRRDTWQDLRASGDADKATEFKGLRWVLLRNWENLSGRQKGVIRDLATANKRMFRAWQLKEELREIMAMGPIAAARALDDWLAWASRSKLGPFVKLARTVRRYRESIEATIEWRLTNGLAESNNSEIGRLRRNARGFHKPEKFITMVMLSRGELCPDLPWQQAA